jgi:hypothetical protein
LTAHLQLLLQVIENFAQVLLQHHISHWARWLRQLAQHLDTLLQVQSGMLVAQRASLVSLK